MRITSDAMKALALWAVWQGFVICALGIAFVNLFTEYGWFPNTSVTPYAAVVFVVGALWAGTWLPLKRWKKGLEPTPAASRRS